MATTHKPKLGLTLSSTIFLFFSIAVLPSDAVSKPYTPTLTELLPRYGLPSGLFPDSVVNYTLSPSHQLFVQLAKPCYVYLGDTIYYDRAIRGVLSPGSISSLEGIQINQIFWIWSKVFEILVDLRPTDNIYFKLGDINYLNYDIHHFKIVNSCGENSIMASGFRSFKKALQLPVVKAAAHLSNETQMLAAGQI